jgi:hypothetical protein
MILIRQIHYSGHWKSRAVKISTFLGPIAALALLVAISEPQKVLIYRAHPFQLPSKWIFLHQNHYIPHHTIGTVIVLKNRRKYRGI